MKNLFAVVLSVASVASAWAGVTGTITEPRRLSNTDTSKFMNFEQVNVQKVESHASRAEKTLDYSPAYEPYSATGLNGQTKGLRLAQAFEMTPDVSTSFAGCEITSFNFYLGSHTYNNKNGIRNYTIFITKDLTEEPFYTQEFTTNKSTAYSQCKVELETPYTIKEGESIYIGMEYALTSQYDTHLVFDFSEHEDIEGGWLGIYNTESEKFVWGNLADQIGFLCLGATIKGEKMPDNQAAVDIVAGQPVVIKGEPFDFQMMYHNTGVTPISTVEVKYTVGENAPVTQSYKYTSQQVGYNQFAALTFSGVVYEKTSEDDVEIKVEVTKVNGVDNVDRNRVGTTTFFCLPKGVGYQKNVVLEEVTGTWCGYCPRGIVIMENIVESITDGSIIPVAVHSGDAMAKDSWANVAAIAGGKAPYAIINRYYEADLSSYDVVVADCKTVMEIPAIGKIAVQTEKVEADHSINITATSEFIFDIKDAAKRYGIAFGITQDNVGPYLQNNYYSGGKYGTCGGWEQKGESVETIFNDVALDLVNANGLPNEVKAATPYSLTYNYKLDSTIDFKDVHVVAYLMDLRSGIVENAATVRDVAGVDTVVADDNANAPVEYYNLQGVRVENPANGIFVRRQGKAVSKVVIR